MVSREKKLAAAALLLLLAQDEDFLEDFEVPPPRRHEAPPPRRREAPPPRRFEAPPPRRFEAPPPRHHAPSRVAREAKPYSIQFAIEDDVDCLAVEVEEPVDQYLPNSSQTAANTDSASNTQKENVVAIQTKRPLDEEAGGSTTNGAAPEQRKRRKRRVWAHEMYLHRGCPPDHPLTEGIPYLDPSEDLRILRMSEECFETLLKLVSPLIGKKNTLMRDAISPRQRLVAVLRYLVTGKSAMELKFSTLLSPGTMNTVLPETCQAIIQVLGPKYMKFPEKKEDWLKISNEFSASHDFPNCGGTMNARHVCIFKRVGTEYHVNHKGYSSVILATLVDANHRFISAEVIDGERESDESAISSTEFYQKLYEDSLGLPDNTETEGKLDFVFVAPNSFPVHERVLMTYPVVQVDVHAKITYNDKIREVNRYSDNVLGLLASRFGVLRTVINRNLWKLDPILRACCAIHNFLSVECKDEYLSDDTYDHRDEAGNLVLGDWRRSNDEEFNYAPLETFMRGPTPETDRTREQYVEYFCAKLVERNLNLLL